MLTMGQWVIAEKSSKVDFVDIQREFQGVFFFFFFILHMTQNFWNAMCQYFEKYFFFSFKIIRMLGETSLKYT